MTKAVDATLQVADKELDLPGRRRPSRATTGSSVSAAAQGDRPRHLRRRLRQHRVVQERHHLHRRRRRASCATAATRSSSWPRSRTLRRGLLPAHLRRAAHAERAGRLRGPHPPAHDAARGPQARSSTASRATRTRCRCSRSAVSALAHLLPGQPRPLRPGAGRDLDRPPPRQAADHRGHSAQEVRRPAVPLPRQLAVVRRELPADDVRLPGRALRGRPDRRQGPRPAASSCTPTTSRTARPRRCASSAPPTPTCSPRSRPASTPCPARCTAAPTRPSSRCSSRSSDARRRPKSSWTKVKNKEDGVRLMGFGHRVYKNYDPRAAIIKKTADDILEKLGQHDPLLEIAHGPRGDRARRRLLRRAQALPERRLLHRPDLQGHGLPDEDVHRALRPRPPARLDRPVARDDRPTPRRRSAARARSTPASPSATTSASTPAESPERPSQARPAPERPTSRWAERWRRSGCGRLHAVDQASRTTTDVAGTGVRGALPGPGALVPAAAPRALAHVTVAVPWCSARATAHAPAAQAARPGLRQGDGLPGGLPVIPSSA